MQKALHSHVPVGTEAFWILEQRQSSRWAGQRWVLGATRWGVLPCRILFRYPRRLWIGSRRQGTEEGGVGSWIVTLWSERESQPACQSGSVPSCCHVSACQSARQVGKRCETGRLCTEASRAKPRTKWWCWPSAGRRPTPKQIDGRDVSLGFSITHGFAHPVAAVAAVSREHRHGPGLDRRKVFLGS